MDEHLRHAIQIDGRQLSLEAVELIARDDHQAILAPSAVSDIRASRGIVSHYVESQIPGYGINTGFGSLSDRTISVDDTRMLQVNLLRSHAAGVGEPLPRDTVRAAMAMRANSLALGYSGVREVVIETLLDLLNHGVTPHVPSQGSLGASGDLAPLAHMALPLIGLGDVDVAGNSISAGEALEQTGITPIELQPKEALALINGTQIISAISTLALLDAERLVETAISVAALSLAAINALRSPFDARVQLIRPHPGQIEVAEKIRNLLEQLDEVERPTKRVQDPYSVRCIPQVFGAIADSLKPLRQALEIEINSATDNPLIFADDATVISGGNFHGHPLALKIEAAKIGIASLGTINERRIRLLVEGEEYGLPNFLVNNPGINNGFMICHYLSAGLVSENRLLAHPTSTDSIPTSANVEDFNSMGAIAARYFREIVDNVEEIVAVEALCAAQACDLTRRVPAGPLGEIYRRIRAAVPFLERDDRVLSSDIESIRLLVHSGELIAAAQEGEHDS